MTNDMLPPAVRRAARALALVPGALALVAAGPALAERPDVDAWTSGPENDSKLHALLVLGGTPLLLFIAIWVLVSLPSMLKGQKYDAAVAFRDNPEWFGGPRRGVDAAPDDASEPQGRGGTSAQW